ncbi:hypothetical protein HU200_006323 [Digitaria exilis]|uniref:DUF4220 domain-containing protein n=1 Tax=Digitaria exilis TaxID=1010633 RepID=A0A835KQT3_9POAL|nr:hypothetical protein HU200_006323 [Digitaria exilis]
MAGAEAVLHVWKEWGIQLLILLSFTIQVVLLILADLRRSIDSGVLRACVWSAYLLADSTAIYVLGHLSVTSRSPEHELMGFWAPFLLLHLGGQDNITAYAIEDNRLWLRHLQTLAVQVAAAAYALYESPFLGSGSSLLRAASVLMFGVGVAKYGERVWALKAPSTEGLQTDLTDEEVFKVVEMQLSLMHDVFYTKIGVIHGWYGFCIRIISLLATTIALVLFHIFGDQKEVVYSKLDVAVTYVLLIGALVMELTSIFRFVFSSWTCALLITCGTRWHLPARAVLSLRRLVPWKARYWSGSMGQHNMLQLCARSRTSRGSKVARWIGAEDPWNMLVCSWSVPVSEFIEQLMVKQAGKNSHWRVEHPLAARIQELVNKGGMYGDLDWTVEESILVWHIATDIYLYWCRENEQEKATGETEQTRRRADLAKAAEALSNYMLFLLASRPYMLPPPNGRNAYVQKDHLDSLEYSSAQDLAKSLQRLGSELNTGTIELTSTTPVIGRRDSATSMKGAQLGEKLIGQDLQVVGSSSGESDTLELIVEVWLEMLFYVGYRCSAHSHSKQLSSGGELVTIAALLCKYIRAPPELGFK